MRTLLHFGLFVLALTAVGEASADDHRRSERRTTIVIAPQTSHRTARPVRAPVEPRPPSYDYDSRHPWHHHSRGLAEARREVQQQRQDHEQILRIAGRWERATVHRDLHAQHNVERRLNAWIDREIEESNRKPDHGRYVHRLHALRRELRYSRSWYGYGYGHGRHRSNAHKATIIEELVELSERHLRWAENRARRHMRLAFAYR